MGTIQGSVICPSIQAKQVVRASGPFTKATVLRSGVRGYKDVLRQTTRAGIVSRPLRIRRSVAVRCMFSSFSSGSGRAENFRENDDDFVNSSVIEAVEIRNGSAGFTISMKDGRYLRCIHNSPPGGHLPNYAPHPAIVLKMEDGTDLLFPIIVLEMPSVWLMAAISNVHIARPTMYQVIKEMIEKMGYEVKLVRVTKRVQEAYFAQIYLTKVGNEADCISFDIRPSDAINIAVRCKVPIQVHRNLAKSDGMKIVESLKSLPSSGPSSDGVMYPELDRPSGQDCIETTEFNLLRNMLDAANAERYQEAAEWRNKLTQFRAKRNWA